MNAKGTKIAKEKQRVPLAMPCGCGYRPEPIRETLAVAIVHYIRQRRFATVLPGEPRLTPFDWPQDDEGIWERVSGELVELDGVPHALFRHAGVLYLRIGTSDFELDELAQSSLVVEDDYLRLRIECAAGTFVIKEPFPAHLRNNPLLDHLQSESNLWTYSVHSVLSEPNGRQSFWTAER
ncbi:MAG: hypothetical protein KF838_00820 [Phycisphaeraceae bacterium]|nr:MAG: hypothetical protein KF838_00820 [Phycisphaeraceae bacterium]